MLVEVGSDIKNFRLEELTVQVGTTVNWTNLDVSGHTTTAGEPGELTGTWDSGTVSTGQSFSFTFGQTGTFRYFCEIHPFMQATVTVTQEAPPPATPTSTPTPTPTPSPTPSSTGGGGGGSGGGYGY